jgi:HAMP domain-containing protein
MNKKGTIILDFLMFVITATVIAVSVITYLNINEIKRGYLRELNTTVKNIVFIFENCSDTEIENNSSENSFKELSEKIIKSNGDKIYSIGISRIKSEDEIEEIFSTEKSENEKIEKIKNIKTILENNKESVRQIEKNGVQIYNFLKINENGEIINIKISLENAVNEFRRAFILNVAVAVLAIIFMVGFTTYILLNKIYKPIQQLREEIKKIEDGEIAHELNLGVNNELNDLAHEISKMKDSLWEKSFLDKFSHPVTGLPGLMSEIETVSDMIERDETFGLLNITIKNFEKYVLRAGLVKGEDYLRNFYNTIEESASEKEVKGHKMFQIRENSIALFTTPEKAEELAKSIVEKFDREFIPLYESVSIGKEIDNQINIKISNINGEEIDYPCTRLIISIIINKVRGDIISYKDIEGKILKIETLYSGIDNKSYCIVAGEELSEVKEEEKIEEKEDDLLAGLDKIEKKE